MKSTCLIVLAFLLTTPLSSQSDTLALPAIEVIETQLSLVAEEKAFVRDDDAIKAAWSNLAQLNDLAPAFFINQFSAKGLASPNYRGLGFERTLVQWNGLSINSPANGGIDYQLISQQAGNSWKFYTGGHAALAGSGAVGGVLAIDEDWRANGKYRHHIGLSRNSFQDSFQKVKFSWKTKNYLGNVKFASAFGGDNYAYKKDGKTFQRDNTRSKSFHIFQNNQWKINKHLLAIHLWGSKTERELPANLFASYQGEKQYDNNLRFALNHQFIGKKGVFKNSIGALMENIEYENNFISFKPTVVYRSSYKGNYETQLKDTWRLMLGIESATEWSNSYQNRRTQFVSFSGFATIKKEWKKQFFTASLRPTVRIDGDAPLTGFVEYRIDRNRFSLLAKASKDYRQPTLNDLYWRGAMEQGNLDLKSESSWNQELQLTYFLKKGQYGWTFTANVFSTLVDDWIQWRFDQNWSPENLKKVWTRGVSLDVDFAFTRDRWKIETRGSYTFNPAAEIQTERIGSTLLSNQLIRTPLHQGNLMCLLAVGKWSFNYSHRLVGSRKLTADDSSRSPAFHLGNTTVNFQITKRLQSSLHMMNLWDAYYEHVPGQPLPGRSIQLSADFSF